MEFLSLHIPRAWTRICDWWVMQKAHVLDNCRVASPGTPLNVSWSWQRHFSPVLVLPEVHKLKWHFSNCRQQENSELIASGGIVQRFPQPSRRSWGLYVVNWPTNEVISSKQ
jgi:hypothetical protein